MESRHRPSRRHSIELKIAQLDLAVDAKGCWDQPQRRDEHLSMQRAERHIPPEDMASLVVLVDVVGGQPFLVHPHHYFSENCCGIPCSLQAEVKVHPSHVLVASDHFQSWLALVAPARFALLHHSVTDFEHHMAVDLLLGTVFLLRKLLQALLCLWVVVHSRQDPPGHKDLLFQLQRHPPMIEHPRASVCRILLVVGSRVAALSDLCSSLLQLPFQHQRQLSRPLATHLFHGQDSHLLVRILLFRQSLVEALVLLHIRLSNHRFLRVVDTLLFLAVDHSHRLLEEKMHYLEYIVLARVAYSGFDDLPTAVVP